MIKKIRTNLNKKKKHLGIILIMVPLIIFFQGSTYAKTSIAQSNLNYLTSCNSLKNKNAIYPEQYIIDGKCTYYVSPYDRNIYKIVDGQNKKIRLSIHEVDDTGIVLNNGYIYYQNKLDKNKLYRVGTNGKNRMRVAKSGKYFIYDNFFKWGNNIYYYTNKQSIYKINDNIVETKLSNYEVNIVSKLSRFSKIYNGYIYSYDLNSYKGIYSTSINTGKRIRVCSDNIYPEVRIYKDSLYYINYDDGKLYKLAFNGNKKTRVLSERILDKANEYDMASFDIINDNIYFINKNNKESGNLAKIDINGKNKKILFKKILDFKCYKNRLYYVVSNDNGILYSSDINGKQVKCLQKDNFCGIINIMDDKIVCFVKSISVMQPDDGRVFLRYLNKNKYIELK